MQSPQNNLVTKHLILYPYTVIQSYIFRRIVIHSQIFSFRDFKNIFQVKHVLYLSESLLVFPHAMSFSQSKEDGLACFVLFCFVLFWFSFHLGVFGWFAGLGFFKILFSYSIFLKFPNLFSSSFP